MTAAVYARKSTDQTSVADEQRSVARQIDHARHYATRKGWTVSDEHVYVDDGISGAEFSNRPGFIRMMNALKPRPPFQVLIMSEESRLGREAIETAYALKQLVTAGARVFFYLEDREHRPLPRPFALEFVGVRGQRQHDLVGGGVERAFAILKIEEHADARGHELLECVRGFDRFASEPAFL
jgi:hypothetical protein